MGVIAWILNQSQNVGEWAEIQTGGGSLPPGGATGEVLTKESDADGDAGWEPAGGSVPVTKGYYTAGADPIDCAGDRSATLLPFILSDGDALLNLGDPTSPTIVDAGTYALTVTLIYLGADLPDKLGWVSAELDENGFFIYQASQFRLDDDGVFSNADHGVTVVGHCPAGAVLNVRVKQNSDAPQGFKMDAYLQRLS